MGRGGDGSQAKRQAPVAAARGAGKRPPSPVKTAGARPAGRPYRWAGRAALAALAAAYLPGVALRVRTVRDAVPQSPGQAYVDELAAFRNATAEVTETVRAHRFLVIGGTGFTGSALVHDLRRRGAALVRVMGRTLPPAVEYPYDGEAYPLHGVEYARGDVTDAAALDRAMAGVSVVFHTAAHYGAPKFGGLGAGAVEERANYGGVLNILAAAQRARVQQVVYTSTSDVVFTGRVLRGANESHPYATLEGAAGHEAYATGHLAVGDHYARTKIMAERALLAGDGEAGVRTLSLRPNGIHGPGENSAFPKAVAPAFVLGAMPSHFGEDQETEWVCVSNLVYAHVLAVHKLATAPDLVGGKAFFITDGELTNNAAYRIFEPAMRAVGVTHTQGVFVPPSLFVAAAGGMEWASWHVARLTGFDFFAACPAVTFSQKEALKTVTTHTHDITRARELLGYRPLMTTKQCGAHVAEEFGRRWGTMS